MGKPHVCRCSRPKYHRKQEPAQTLDVKLLAEWFHNRREAKGLACWHGNQHIRSWDCGQDALEAIEYASPAEAAESDPTTQQLLDREASWGPEAEALDKVEFCNKDAYCFREPGHFGGCTPNPTPADA